MHQSSSKILGRGDGIIFHGRKRESNSESAARARSSDPLTGPRHSRPNVLIAEAQAPGSPQETVCPASKAILRLETHRTVPVPMKTHANKPSAQLTGSGTATMTLPLTVGGTPLLSVLDTSSFVGSLPQVSAVCPRVALAVNCTERMVVLSGSVKPERSIQAQVSVPGVSVPKRLNPVVASRPVGVGCSNVSNPLFQVKLN